jgi:hypothetical protein
MKIEQKQWRAGDYGSHHTYSYTGRTGHHSAGLFGENKEDLGETAHLVLLFGSVSLLSQSELLTQIQQTYPNAYLFGCSTAGEISGTTVLDDSLVSTAVEFERTRIKCAEIKLRGVEDSYSAGKHLVPYQLNSNGL